MGKISNYARVLKAKLQDVFVVNQTDNNVTSTKSVTVEQIGDAICGEQVHADLETDDQTIIGGINELAKDKNIADEYDDTHTYNIGDITIYGNTLYICNTNNITGTFDPSKWTATTIDNIIGSLSTLTTTDKSSLVGAVNEIATYTPVYGNTASGAIATFDTSLALPLQDCTIAINAVQEAGTPTPSSPKAISGFTGANIKVAGNLLNGNKVQVGDRTVRLGELAGNTYSTHLLATTYTISFTRPTNKAFRFDLIDSNNTVTTLIPFSSTNNSVTFNITTEGDYCFSIYLYAGVSPSDIDNVMLVGGSSVAPYTPYTTPTTTAISWQDEAGTVYGGLLDVTTGVLTVTMIGHVFDGTETFISLEGGTVFAYNFGSKVRSSYQQTNSLNTHFTNNTAGNSWANVATDCYLIAGDYYVGVNPNMSLADYKTWLGTQNTNGTPVKAVATLQTPTTYQLTPTQISAIVGTNNIFTDTNGNTSVVYACSLKDYIDGQ